jgi:hypothetical protein
MTRHVGIVIADRGSAIVTVERGAANALVVTGIERLPFDLAAVTERVRALEDPETPTNFEVFQSSGRGGSPARAQFVVDAEGLGSALWAVLGRPRRNWRLYSGRGLERQALVDELVVAIQEDRFHFAPDLALQAVLDKALLSYRRQVREDGQIGSEVVVALLLALIPPPPRPPRMSTC